MAPTDVPRELPNFEKMVLLGQQILELEAYRRVPYGIEVNPTGTYYLHYCEATTHDMSFFYARLVCLLTNCGVCVCGVCV
jgi:hypothetical protein